MYYANQYVITYLSVTGGIDNSQTTGIVIQDPTGIDTTKPTIACINWSDPLDEDLAEWVYLTSIDGSNEFQGVTRGAEKGSAKAHNDGVAVAFPASESHINQFADIFEKTATTSIADNVSFEEQSSAPTTPASGYSKVYIDTSGIIKALGSGGTPVEVGATSDPWRTITLTPGFLKPKTTGGCAASQTIEAATNDIDYDVLDFDASTDEAAFANFQMPDSWDGGAIQFRYIWTNASGLTTETVTFSLSGRSFSDDDAIDQANGTAVALEDTWIAQGDIHQSSWSDNVTLAGTPAAGEWVHIEIMRDVSEDDLTGDARLISVQIRYKQTKFSD